ncbi:MULTISPECIES: TIGR03546 family protein [Alteromonadaceae]|uniref:TIGR03546 family protein n=1 Tax=Alteromonadaceae TaxID=72275 RepID=UPI001C08994B|nr:MULTISPECIES: TIGR03546 family protein [unclassified Aliiglaciecola]MBU2878771.1 TIGR03546 family protein [Aliiglaciecola lipolytica]MDO6711331.1 TIGR03546 family protein [Aliiglaciecola sp. 2_MG-2023]MDO6752220.1 TIGR03546 family protein [Aliiglaciecola sp. 1_MG-2023]
MFVFAKLLKALHSDAGPWSLAFGIMLGMIFGLTPLIKLHNLIILFVVLFCRVNLSTFILSWGVFSALALILDPMMMNIGEAILTSENLQSIWTSFYNTGFGRLSQFYNTLTMGSLALSLALSPLVLIVSRILVVKYREHFLAWVEQWRILQIIKGSRVYQMYQRFGG